MNKRILLIKLTSLGDLIHTLPALTDAYLTNPQLEIDWLIDENFQEVATWHPIVKNIFTANHRQWRHALKNPKTYSSIFNLVKSLRKKKYDLIIDGQGNFKTAALSLCTRGIKAGYDRHSVREWVAFLAYQKKISVSKNIHAIERLRLLLAHALNYNPPSTPPQFLINQNKFYSPPCSLPSSYLVFVHNASWKTKLWPEEHWKSLIKRTLEIGHAVVLPWGNEEERERAHRLAISKQVQVLPALSLSQIGYVLLNAQANVCVDTGLSHLSAALNIPCITLYGPTDTGLIGTSGRNQLHMQSSLACAPCNKKYCSYSREAINPPCLAEQHPEMIFSKLKNILKLKG